MVKISTVGSIFTNSGKKIILNRAFKATPDYATITRFKNGINSSVPNIADTDLDNSIPISDGLIFDGGDRNLTGKYGGLDSTSGSATFKEGAGTNDGISQNLLTTTTSGSKTYYFDSGSLNQNISGTSDNVGIWLYVKDSTTRNYFKTSGTAVELRFGSGTADNYYAKGFSVSSISVGWNFLTSGTSVQNLDMSGSVNGGMDSFVIQILTNNAADSWSSGDVIYDLLRGWKEEDTFKDLVSGSYPTINESTFIVENRGKLTTTNANGFDIDSFGDFNSGTMIGGKDVFTSESKSSLDLFTFVIQNRLL